MVNHSVLSYKRYSYHEPFTLESGHVLAGFHLAYTTYGQLNPTRDNVIWVFHALTANSDPAEWWPGLFGEKGYFSPEHYYIICVNMPGSPYGSIHPLDVNATTGESYYHHFPLFTIQDMVKAYQQLRIFLGIEKILIGIGGSMGGQQLLEWAVKEPDLFEYIIPIATNASHSPWGIAFNTSQRWCIENDPSWNTQNVNAGLEGMKIARSIALISYRHYITFQESQQGIASSTLHHTIDRQQFKASTYQYYQGEKLARRFNAFSYYFLSKSMDTHDVGRRRGSVEEALGRIKAKALVIGIETDILFPLTEQQLLAAHIPAAEYNVVHSQYGHDGFLLEYVQIKKIIRDFFRRKIQTTCDLELLN